MSAPAFTPVAGTPVWWRRLRALPAALGVALIRCYQLGLSPILPPACRFAPTCSEYGIEALKQHGAIRGSWLLFRRLLRCRPGCACGYDPVPPPRERRRGDPRSHSPRSLRSPTSSP